MLLSSLTLAAIPPSCICTSKRQKPHAKTSKSHTLKRPYVQAITSKRSRPNSLAPRDHDIYNKFKLYANRRRYSLIYNLLSGISVFKLYISDIYTVCSTVMVARNISNVRFISLPKGIITITQQIKILTHLSAHTLHNNIFCIFYL